MKDARRVLEVKNLNVTRGGVSEVEDLSFSLDVGETLIVLGDQNSGKDALMRVLANFSERGSVASGTIRYGNGDAKPAQRRGKPTIRLAYLCGPRAAPLNPHISTVSQLGRIVARKQGGPSDSGREEMRIALGRLAGAPSFDDVDRKPSQLSDVQVAWALLAAAMAQAPDLLIADHAFGGLTPISVELLANALLDEQQRQRFAIVYFAQTLQPAAHLRSRMIVLRAGKVIEEGDFEKLASGQSHAYTQTLFKSLPRFAKASPARATTRGEPLLQVQGLDLSARRRRSAPSRDAISFELRRGAALALLGEEGSGRRALMRAILGLQRFSAGRVALDQVDISILSEEMKSRQRRRIAFITGSDAALDPRMTLWDTIDEPLRAHLRLPRQLIAGYREAALKRVGLASYDGRASVATLSAFDKRRLQVARAIVAAPFLAVIDEPLRGLDAFSQWIMIDLLRDLQRQEGPAFLLITADMRVAQALADEVMVLKDAKLVERGPIRDILRAPRDAETKRLLAAAAPHRRPRSAKVETAADEAKLPLTQAADVPTFRDLRIIPPANEPAPAQSDLTPATQPIADESSSETPVGSDVPNDLDGATQSSE